MAFLKNIAPVVRGQCDECGNSRNLFANEIVEDVVLCNHRDRGCRGQYRIVFTGPKALIPSHLHNVQCRCVAGGGGPGAAGGARGGSVGSSSSSAGARSALLAQLMDMGFPEQDARQAVERHGDDAGAAVEWLTGPREASQLPCAIAWAADVPGSSSASSSAPAAAPAPMPVEDVGECSICCEDLLLADAAMRCLGQGGKKHYFHAHCLASWVRECQRTGHETTCPECRGPVQVRPRRLQEFLQDKGRKLDAEDQEVLRSFRAAAEQNVDDEGWSDVKRDLLTAGAIVGVGLGVAFAIAAGLRALNSQRESRRDNRR